MNEKPEFNPDAVHYIVPVVMQEGTFFSMKNEAIELHFFQLRAVKDPKKPHIDSVAAVKFNNVNELKNLEKEIRNKIREIENSEG